MQLSHICDLAGSIWLDIKLLRTKQKELKDALMTQAGRELAKEEVFRLQTKIALAL